MRLIDAPVGLFLCDGVMGMKTEYFTDGRVDAFVVESGEFFCGGATTTEELNNLEVVPIDAVPVVRCKDCVYRHLTGKAPFMYYTCTVAEGLNVCKSDAFCSYGERRKDATD